MLPHLDAAYRLAVYLIRERGDAEEVVQEAYLRAFQYFDPRRSDYSRAWLLRIVRNTCFTLMRIGRPDDEYFDEHIHLPDEDPPSPVVAMIPTPEVQAQMQETRDAVTRAIESLPPAFREVIVLRELEQYSYREIAEILELAQGTVMSRLSRARKLLKAHFCNETDLEIDDAL